MHPTMENTSHHQPYQLSPKFAHHSQKPLTPPPQIYDDINYTNPVTPSPLPQKDDNNGKMTLEIPSLVGGKGQ